MERTVTIELEKTDREALAAVMAWTGFPPEIAALYAVRLVGACLREGILDDIQADVLPEDARRMTEVGGKVIAFPGHAAVRAKES